MSEQTVITGLPICIYCKHARVKTHRLLLSRKFWSREETYSEPYITGVRCMRLGFDTDPVNGMYCSPESGVDAVQARSQIELCGLHARYYESNGS